MSKRGIPNREAAYAVALGYVAGKVGRGVTAAQMEAAVFEGVGGPSEPGYQLRSGKITVPGTRFQGPQFTFSTSKLVEAIEAGQGDLFGSPIAAAGHH